MPLPSTRLLAPLLAIALLAVPASNAFAVPTGCPSADETALAQLINQWRAQNGKAAVPLTKSLTLVAQWKIQDMASPNFPTSAGGCNSNSWSNDNPTLYSGCCYTGSATAACMWNKPNQITQGIYAAFGYEIVATGATSIQNALNAWKGSTAHNDVLLNLGPWASRNPWPAMGVGVDLVNRRYVVWFGDAADPQAPCVLPVPEDLGAALAIASLGGNPTRGGPLAVRFALPSADRARLDLFDVTGRRLSSREVGEYGAGTHTTTLAAPGELATGLYLVVLRQGVEKRTLRIAITD